MLITEHRFAHFWFSFTEKLKMFGSISKHILCHIEKFTTRKNVFLEIVKCIYNFAKPENASITDSPHCLLLS